MRVSEEDFAAIIEAGRMSPSSMGFEPWHFVRINNRDLINEMLPYMWGPPANSKTPATSSPSSAATSTR
ncbi:MAG: nitroreductase family protein [Lawsonella clevelandensis]